MDNKKTLTLEDIEEFEKEIYDGVNEFYKAVFRESVPPQLRWKVYDLEEIKAKIPEEIEPLRPIVPPAGYKVTENTKIKYLKLYSEFIKYATEYVIELDADLKAIDPNDSFMNCLKDGADRHIYDITSFYEETFDKRDGDLAKMLGDFVSLFDLVVQGKEEY